MKYVRLSKEEEFTIVEIRKFHPKARVRERAQIVELSNNDKTIDQITEIVGRNRDTVSTWLNKYEKYGIAGLFDGEKTGAPRKLTDPVKNRILEIVELLDTCTTEYLKTTIETEFDLKLHPNTIKNTLRKEGYVYKRTRNSLKKKRDQKKIW